MGDRFRVFNFRPPSSCGGDYEGAFQLLSDDIEEMLENIRGQGVKYYLGTSMEMGQLVEDKTGNFGFNVDASTLLQSTDIAESLRKQIKLLTETVDSFVRRGSGWVCHAVKGVSLNVARSVGGCTTKP